jgi:hypothetical protein
MAQLRQVGSITWPPQTQWHCQHCFCQNTTVGQVRHRVCCMCGHREAIRSTWGQPIRLG